MRKPALLILCFFILAMLFACGKELSTPEPYPITCYAASYGRGIYSSNNGGESWYPLDRDQKEYYAYFKKINPDPDNKQRLYITTTGAGLFKADLSTGGVERIDPFKDPNATSLLLIDKGDQGMRPSLLISLNNGGVYQSDTEMISWHPMNQGLVYRDVNTLYRHEKDLFAGTTRDLFKWDNDNDKWVSSSQGIRNKNILAVSGMHGGITLFAGSGAYNGIKGRFEDIPCLYKSTDAGRSWQASDKGLPDGTLVYCMAFTRSRPQSIYLGSSDGVYRSIDEGKNWSKVQKGLPEPFRVIDMKTETMPDGNSVIYAAGSKGIFMTVDDGKSGWVSRNYGLPPTTITSMIILKD